MPRRLLFGQLATRSFSLLLHSSSFIPPNPFEVKAKSLAASAAGSVCPHPLTVTRELPTSRVLTQGRRYSDMRRKASGEEPVRQTQRNCSPSPFRADVSAAYLLPSNCLARRHRCFFGLDSVDQIHLGKTSAAARDFYAGWFRQLCQCSPCLVFSTCRYTVAPCCPFL